MEKQLMMVMRTLIGIELKKGLKQKHQNMIQGECHMDEDFLSMQTRAEGTQERC
jgi:hypothetical protein